MPAPCIIRRDMVDNDSPVGLSDLIADGRLDLQFASGLKSEGDIVAHAACDPSVPSDAGNCCKSHARRPAHDIKDGGNRRYAADGPYVGCEILLQDAASKSVRDDRQIGSTIALSGALPGRPKGVISVALAYRRTRALYGRGPDA
jgi:hypothetical protein